MTIAIALNDVREGSPPPACLVRVKLIEGFVNQVTLHMWLGFVKTYHFASKLLTYPGSHGTVHFHRSAESSYNCICFSV